jgi:hypothetical protein
MAFKGSETITAKLMDTTELLKEFKYTGCSITFLNNNKLRRFQNTERSALRCAKFQNVIIRVKYSQKCYHHMSGY